MIAKNEDGETMSAAAQKQHRRTQVRRAQMLAIPPCSIQNSTD